MVTSGGSLANGRRLMRSLYCWLGLGFARATFAWTARSVSIKLRIAGDNALYAATRLVQNVSPPYGGIVTPRRIEAKGGLTAAVTSGCQPKQGVTLIASYFSFAVRTLATE